MTTSIARGGDGGGFDGSSDQLGRVRLLTEAEEKQLHERCYRVTSDRMSLRTWVWVRQARDLL